MRRLRAFFSPRDPRPERLSVPMAYYKDLRLKLHGAEQDSQRLNYLITTGRWVSGTPEMGYGLIECDGTGGMPKGTTPREAIDRAMRDRK